jgi:hypothetical protein
MYPRPAPRYEKLLILVLSGGLLTFVLAGQASAFETLTEGYVRPDPAAVHSELQDILSDSRFAPRQTLWQWLSKKLMNWQPPDMNLPSWLARALVWALLIWCILALLAILAHLVWTLGILFGWGAYPGGGSTTGRTLAERLRHRSLEDLSTMMQELAERGEYREALGVMMIALLRWLDRAGAVRFHESKTNGEYVMEYSPDRRERDDFNRFVISFEGTIYGGRDCEAERYLSMCNLFERIRANAGQDPQV